GGDLRREPLLDLQAPRIHLDETRDLREPDDLFPRHVSDVALAHEGQEMMLTVVREVSAHEEGGIRRTGEGVNAVRLVRAGESPHTDNRGVRTVDGHVELAPLSEAMLTEPARLVPTIRYIETRAAHPLYAERCVQILGQSRQELAVSADNEPALADGIAVAIAVAVENPLHHLLGRRDDQRKLERRRRRPRALLGDAEPTAHLCSDRPRHGAN